MLQQTNGKVVCQTDEKSSVADKWEKSCDREMKKVVWQTNEKNGATGIWESSVTDRCKSSVTDKWKK